MKISAEIKTQSMMQICMYNVIITVFYIFQETFLKQLILRQDFNRKHCYINNKLK